MTTAIRKFDKAELKARQDFAKEQYATDISGARVDDLSKPLNKDRSYPQRVMLGAIIAIHEFDLYSYMNKFTALQAEGYTRYNGPNGMIPEFVEGIGNFKGFMTKPESMQKEELKAVFAQIEEEYKAEIDRHNQKVKADMIEQLVADKQREEAAEAVRKAAAQRQAIEEEVAAAVGF